MAVVRFEVTRRGPYADGVSFGDVGSYTRVDGVLHFAVDPMHAANAGIADLDLAPRATDGAVHFDADVRLIVPEDPRRGNGSLILDVPNRGRSLVAGSLNAAGVAATTDSTTPGDGFAYRHGFSVMTVAWQTDAVPLATALQIRAPIAGGPGGGLRGDAMAEVRPTKAVHSWPISQLGNVPYPPFDAGEASARLFDYEYEDAEPALVPRDRWRFTAGEVVGAPDLVGLDLSLDDGFVPGHIYRAVYTAADPPVVGAGLLALRDAATFVRAGAGGELASGFDRVIGFGVSQTARLLRHFLYAGLNRDEAGVVALDGVLALIGGGMRGEFNHRFALPSWAHAPSLGQLFPFADRPITDHLSGREAGLLDRVKAQQAVPKIFHANTSWEYWRGDASLIHVDTRGGADVEPEPTTRVYHFAGTQHTQGAVPQQRVLPLMGLATRYGMNVVDYSPLSRAALINLDRWVRGDSEPPGSRYPRLSDGTAVPREQILPRFAALPDLDPVEAGRLSRIRRIDLGPQAERGTGAYPPVESEPYPCLVSAVDADLNEVAGVRLPDLTVPVGSHTGWNPQPEDGGDPRLAQTFFGLTRFFARSVDERSAGDPCPALAERYADRDDYQSRVHEAAAALVRDRYLLEGDVPLVVANCVARYDEALRVGAASAAAVTA